MNGCDWLPGGWRYFLFPVTVRVVSGLSERLLCSVSCRKLMPYLAVLISTLVSGQSGCNVAVVESYTYTDVVSIATQYFSLLILQDEHTGYKKAQRSNHTAALRQAQLLTHQLTTTWTGFAATLWEGRKVAVNTYCLFKDTMCLCCPQADTYCISLVFSVLMHPSAVLCYTTLIIPL